MSLVNGWDLGTCIFYDISHQKHNRVVNGVWTQKDRSIGSRLMQFRRPRNARLNRAKMNSGAHRSQLQGWPRPYECALMRTLRRSESRRCNSVVVRPGIPTSSAVQRQRRTLWSDTLSTLLSSDLTAPQWLPTLRRQDDLSGRSNLPGTRGCAFIATIPLHR
jgi:hypothetical protein